MTDFTLNIDFMGLCMFAAAPRQDDPAQGVMHVLFPLPPGGGMGMPGHWHIPVLEFDSGYLNPDSKRDVLGFRSQVRLRNKAFAIGSTDPGVATATLKMCQEIVSLRGTTNLPVDSALFGANTDGRIAGRFSFGAGHNTAVNPGYCWQWEGTKRHLANVIRWTVEGVSEPLQLEYQELVTDPAKPPPAGVHKLPPLYPVADIDGNLVLNLAVHHVPAEEMPLDPPANQSKLHPGESPAHFTPFYVLYPSGVPVQVPIFVSEKGCGGVQSPCEMIGYAGASPYNCMGATDP